MPRRSSTTRVATTARVTCSITPRKANLVGDPEHWPGLNLAYGIADEDQLQFEYLDRTAWHRAGRPDDLDPFYRIATLELSPLPGCEGMSREVYRESARTWIAQAHARHQAELSPEERARYTRPLGVDKVVTTDFETRPKSPERSQRPYVFGRPDARARYTEAVVSIMQAHAELSERFHGGERTVRFPEGTYLPPVMRAA